MEKVILVNNRDEEIGTMEKLEVHRKGLLHRAFSVFIINHDRELLLQQRSFDKYHSAGLWSNTCCSHPRVNEDIITAGSRRLQEEMGISADLNSLFSFIYKAEFPNGLIEHEFDHVLWGISNEKPRLNIDEANNFKYLGLDQIEYELINSPDSYTVWFKLIFKQFCRELDEHYPV